MIKAMLAKGGVICPCPGQSRVVFFYSYVYLLMITEDISKSCFVEMNNSLESFSSLPLCWYITLHIFFLVQNFKSIRMKNL